MKPAYSEKQRLIDLYAMRVLDPAPDAVLDAFCENVAQLFDVPTCVVSLVLDDRQWFKASYGCPLELAQVRETPREISFCTHVVERQAPLVVRNAFEDPRFAHNPLVERYQLSFYAGFPLRTATGSVLGSLCLYDTTPREFCDHDVQILGLLSERVMAHLEVSRELEHVREAEARFSDIVEIASDAIVSVDDAQSIVLFNHGAERTFGYTRDEILGQPLERLLPARLHAVHRQHIGDFAGSSAVARRMGERREVYGRRKNGEEFPAEASISKLALGTGTLFTVVLRDISERKRSELENKATLSLLEATVESTADGILVVDPAGKIIHHNRKFTTMWRIPEHIMAAGADAEALASVLNQLQDPDAFLKKVQDLYASPDAESSDRLMFKDGRVFERYSQPQRIDGRSVGRVWSFRDVTERVQAEEEVRLLHTMTRLISEADNLHTALDRVLQTVCGATGWVLGQAWLPRDDGLLECSPAWYGRTPTLDLVRRCSETLTFGPNEVLPGRVWTSKEPLWLRGDTLPDAIPCGTIAREAGLHAALGIPVLAADTMVAVLEFYLQDPGQEDSRWLRVVSSAALQIGGLIQRKRAEADLAKQATHDALTDLYNRRSFTDRTLQELARAERHGHAFAILLADLDHFKTVNDTRGHHAGDLVLKTVARRILDASRGTDLVFRWGGDEFVIVLSDVTREGVLTAAKRLRAGVRTIAEELDLDLDLSIGIALYPDHGRTIDDLIRLADRALYLAKKSGDPIKIGEEDYQLTADAIRVVFQPVIAIQPVMNIRSGQVLGYEALSRDPAGKLTVIELFAKYECIGKLHELKRLCFTTQLAKAQELALSRVFINVDFDILKETEAPPKPPLTEVILEISELEALDNVDERLEITSRWRALGYKFAIDDFGAGFISLPFIARFIPEYIKIDRSTLLEAVASPQFKEFMIGLVFALRNYSTEGIIAEGVETERELRTAKEMGVFLIQGFLLGRPQELPVTSTTEPPHSKAA